MKSKLKDDSELFNPGWSSVWAIYSRNNLLRSIWLPGILGLISLTTCLFSDKLSIELIEYISNIITSVGPSILGFTLSGYALMMGLSNSEFIQGLIRYKEQGKKYSLFQSLNSTFAIVLGSMFVTTIIGVLAGLISKAQIEPLPFFEPISEAYNWFCLFIMVFLLFYTINSIKDIVINIFNFGQYVQIYVDNDDEDSTE